MRGQVSSRILTAVLVLSAVSWSGSLAAACLRYGVVTLTGVVGAPSTASARSGENLLDALVDAFTALLGQARAERDPDL